MSEPETNPTEQTEVSEKKGGMKLYIIIAVVVLLLGGGGGAYFFLGGKSGEAETEEKASGKESKGKKASKAKEAEEEEEEEEEKPSKSGKSLKGSLPDDEEVKHIIDLQPFIVNLADSESERYLRMSVSLGVGGEEGGGEEKPDAVFTTRVRNAMLAVLSTKSSADLLTIEGKNKLRKELLKAAQTVSEEPEVKAIYITDFIIQL